MLMKERIGQLVASQIKDLRVVRGLSQAETAKQLNVPLRTYQSWEHNFTTSVENFIKVCHFFDVPSEVLLNRIELNSRNMSKLFQEQSSEYSYLLFEKALQGWSSEELRHWFSREYPAVHETADDWDTFLENCFLDVYHNYPSVLKNTAYKRSREKESALAEMYRLPKDQILIIASGTVKHESIREMLLAPYGAAWMEQWAGENPGARIGISNGYTVARILDSIVRGKVRNTIVFPLNFTNTEVDFPISSTSLISSFLYKQTGYNIQTDTSTEEQVYSSMLLADAAFLGVGSLSEEGLYERMIRSVLGQSKINDIRQAGVIGDFNYHLLDSEGEEKIFPDVISSIGDYGTKSLIKSISLPMFRKKADQGAKIAVAGSGSFKAETVHRVFSGEYANHLLTDETIADRLLEMA